MPALQKGLTAIAQNKTPRPKLNLCPNAPADSAFALSANLTVMERDPQPAGTVKLLLPPGRAGGSLVGLGVAGVRRGGAGQCIA